MDTITSKEKQLDAPDAGRSTKRRAQLGAQFMEALERGSASGDALAPRDAEQAIWDKMYRDKLTGLLDRGGFVVMADALKVELIEKAEESAKYKIAEDLTETITNTTYTEPDLVIKVAELDKESGGERKKYPTERVAFIYIDLNKFSNINNTLGHIVGDTVLAGFANALQDCLREGDVVARLGGDEFAVIMPLDHFYEGVTPSDIRMQLEHKLRGRISAGIKAGNIHLDEAGAAIGVCIGDAYDIDNLGDIMNKADQEMYLHKLYIETSEENRRAKRRAADIPQPE